MVNYALPVDISLESFVFGSTCYPGIVISVENTGQPA